MARYFDKDDVRAVEFSDDQWEKVEGPNGSRTYTSTAAGATATVKFRSAGVADQQHVGLAVGSTFKRNKDGSWEITQA